MGKLLVAQVAGFVSVLLLVGCGGGGGGGGALQYWAKSYGSASSDYAYSAEQTSDDGYVVAGYTDFSGGGGNNDLWVLKLNTNGTVAWQKTYDVSNYDYAHAILQTNDDGYIVAGYGSGDLWLLKLNSDGTVDWQKRYGGADYEWANSIQQTSDGGYIVAGVTYSSYPDYDFWVLKLTSDGTVSWEKIYGGATDDQANSVQQTTDGGYIVAGWTSSFGAGNYDFWVLKLNDDGTVSWQKTYGGTNYDYAQSIQQTSDDGYIVAGFAKSFGEVNGDFWILKLNSDGTISWQKTYGGPEYDYARSIEQTSDGGYIVAGLAESFGAGYADLWVLKLDSVGAVAWQKVYGGTSDDEAYSIHETSDGKYIAVGRTESFGAGNGDVWVLQLKSDGAISFNPASGAYTADTNVIPTDTSASWEDTSVTGADTTATVTDTTATVTDTTATIEQQAP
jgi:uncharacterized delta-60 repeat protein